MESCLKKLGLDADWTVLGDPERDARSRWSSRRKHCTRWDADACIFSNAGRPKRKFRLVLPLSLCHCPCPVVRTSPQTGSDSAVRRTPASCSVFRRPGSASPPAWCCRTGSCEALRRSSRTPGCALLRTLRSSQPETPSRSSRPIAAAPSRNSAPCAPPRRSPLALRQSRPGPPPVDAPAARTSPAGSASAAARSPSRWCIRPGIRAPPAAAQKPAWPCGVASCSGPYLAPGSGR